MILFFDTETTGVPKNYKAPANDLNNWPRLVQLAYLIYDLNGNFITSRDFIIKPVGFTIPIESSAIHGITTEKAFKEGKDLKSVLTEFNSWIEKSEYLIAHNMAFDEKIMGAELIRNSFPNIIENKKRICTMLATVDYCAIKNQFGNKWPTLQELHTKLFNKSFDAAHNAMADIQATARCFWELRKRNIISIDINLNSNSSSNPNSNKVQKSDTGPIISSSGLTHNKASSIIDICGFEYGVVKIGNQLWTNENLHVSKFRNGDNIIFARSADDWNFCLFHMRPAFCYYNFEMKYMGLGTFYNWYAVSDKRGLAPLGWHIPSEVEWTSLIDSLGGKDLAGNKMKSKFGWEENGNGTNESGFDGRPRGYLDANGFYDRDKLEFKEFGKYGRWWCSTIFLNDDNYNVKDYFLNHKSGSIGEEIKPDSCGFSVRCVKSINNESDGSDNEEGINRDWIGYGEWLSGEDGIDFDYEDGIDFDY